jgi:hypothetical protein
MDFMQIAHINFYIHYEQIVQIAHFNYYIHYEQIIHIAHIYLRLKTNIKM